MHRRTLLAGFVAMTVAPAPAMAAEGTRALGCQPQSEGSFNNVYADSRSVVAGPLAPGVTCVRFSVTTGGERTRFALPGAGGACG
jgi:hypothetical protein